MVRWGHSPLLGPTPSTHCPVLLRVPRHSVIPAPVLGMLLVLLLSVLLFGRLQPPTWPHLQLYYLQPPPM